MVEVMVESITETTKVNMAAVVDAHRRAYRSLIAARHTDVLLAGPIPQALANLTAQEESLDADDPARAAFRSAREAILKAVAADRAAHATST